MNPIERIAALELRVAQLEQQQQPQRQEQRSSVGAVRNYELPRPLQDDAKALVLLVWECFEEQGKPVTIKAWCEEIAKHDTENCVPTLRNQGATLRALLAERAGLKVVWAAQPLGGSDA